MRTIPRPQKPKVPVEVKRSDRLAWIPRKLIFLVLGACFSTVGVQITADEYYEGPTQLRYEKYLPVHIEFENIGCAIRGRSITRNITGSILPGRFTAILGQSGSGKTTFAYSILGRGQRFCTEEFGKVYLNGREQNLEAFLDRVGFVPQDDVLYRDLTVQETVEFSAGWRLPRTLNESTVAHTISETLRLLELEHVKHERIGDVQRRGISGGEKKRTSIAMELVAKPSVLVMDEPTSGLDSASAYKLVKMLRNIVNSGVSVVAILHQPSARIFELLDDIILMQQGEVAYIGPKENVTEFLTHVGYSLPKAGLSTSEYIVDVLANLEQAQRGPAPEITANEQLACLEDVSQLVCLNQMDNISHPRLPELWRLYRNSSLYVNGNTFKQRFTSGCEEEVTFQQNRVPKVGLKQQLLLWLYQLIILTWRRGVLVECGVAVSMAGCCAFMRSYNQAWSRRAGVNLLLSINVSLLGMLSALYADDIAPVKRAAAAGMLLNAHEFAVLLVVLGKGYVLCHVFAVSYFTVLWLRTGIWCVETSELPAQRKFDVWRMTRALTYYHFQHIVLMQYLVASAFGSVICVLTNHEHSASYIASVGTVMFWHVFSLYSPNKNQVTRDSLVLQGALDISTVVHKICCVSYVRYFLEVILLWDPEKSDMNGRSYVMRYYGYSDKNKSRCLNVIFFLSAGLHSARFIVFSYRNTTTFNSVYDTPLFFIFLFKVFSLYLLALLAMYSLQEWYFWTLERKMTLRESVAVDILR